MIIERVLRDLDTPDDRHQGGNPLRGSRLGRCARQSAYMLWPDAYPPEPLSARAKLVFRFGDLIHEMIRAEFRRVVPGEWGMEESRFHFKVPLTVRDARIALAKFSDGVLRGTVLQPAGLAQTFGSGVVLTVADARVHRRGLWLDLAEPALYIPLHVDGIADCGEFGLGVTEIKSMASRAFAKAVQGHVDYAYRVQMACAVDAAALDTALYVAVRKDTSHVLEVLYTKRADAVAVTFTKHSKAMDAVRTVTKGGAPADTAQDAHDEGSGALPASRSGGAPPIDWEAAEVRHPFEPHLLERARERVRRILRSSVTDLPAREYGPDFVCPKCAGTGAKRCARCKGHGGFDVAARSCKGCVAGRTKTGKPHAVCGGTGKVPAFTKRCAACKGSGATRCEAKAKLSHATTAHCKAGQMTEAPLPWQCSYCAFVTTCYADAGVRLEIDERPHYLVRREDWARSGLTYRSPE